MTVATRVAFDKWWNGEEDTAIKAGVSREDAYTIYLVGWRDGLRAETQSLKESC